MYYYYYLLINYYICCCCFFIIFFSFSSSSSSSIFFFFIIILLLIIIILLLLYYYIFFHHHIDSPHRSLPWVEMHTYLRSGIGCVADWTLLRFDAARDFLRDFCRFAIARRVIEYGKGLLQKAKIVLVKKG